MTPAECFSVQTGHHGSIVERNRVPNFNSEVEAALAEYGMLLIQGQSHLPSIADLLAGKPVTTQGFSWDYVPAWDYVDMRLTENDVEVVKLYRGQRTVVLKSALPHLFALGHSAYSLIFNLPDMRFHAEFLGLVTHHPGISGETLKELLLRNNSWDNKRYQKTKRELEAYLTIVPRARTDVTYHTHDAAWYLFFKELSEPIAGGGSRLLEALGFLESSSSKIAPSVRCSTLFPVYKFLITRGAHGTVSKEETKSAGSSGFPHA